MLFGIIYIFGIIVQNVLIPSIWPMGKDEVKR